MLKETDSELNISIDARCCVCLIELKVCGTRVPQSKGGDRCVRSSEAGVSVFVLVDSPQRGLQI